jgi:PAS domain-containing protein
MSAQSEKSEIGATKDDFSLPLGSQAATNTQTIEAVRLAEQKYRSIFEHATEGIFQTSLDGHYLSANPALARIYGYGSPDELLTALVDIRSIWRRCLPSRHGSGPHRSGPTQP